MAKGLKYVIAFASAFALMLVARALVVSVHSVNGNGLLQLWNANRRQRTATLQPTDAPTCEEGRHHRL